MNDIKRIKEIKIESTTQGMILMPDNHSDVLTITKHTIEYERVYCNYDFLPIKRAKSKRQNVNWLYKTNSKAFAKKFLKLCEDLVLENENYREMYITDCPPFKISVLLTDGTEKYIGGYAMHFDSDFAKVTKDIISMAPKGELLPRMIRREK